MHQSSSLFRMSYGVLVLIAGTFHLNEMILHLFFTVNVDFPPAKIDAISVVLQKQFKTSLLFVPFLFGILFPSRNRDMLKLKIYHNNLVFILLFFFLECTFSEVSFFVFKILSSAKKRTTPSTGKIGKRSYTTLSLCTKKERTFKLVL